MTFIKKKAGPKLGFRTPDHFKGSTFSEKNNRAGGKFNQARFKIQHKG